MDLIDDPDKRVILSAKISEVSADGWRNFCARNGVSITAFLEVAGRELANEPNPPTEEARIRMVNNAREVDQERRSRRK